MCKSTDDIASKNLHKKLTIIRRFLLYKCRNIKISFSHYIYFNANILHKIGHLNYETQIKCFLFLVDPVVGFFYVYTET